MKNASSACCSIFVMAILYFCNTCNILFLPLNLISFDYKSKSKDTLTFFKKQTSLAEAVRLKFGIVSFSTVFPLLNAATFIKFRRFQVLGVYWGRRLSDRDIYFVVTVSMFQYILKLVKKKNKYNDFELNVMDLENKKSGLLVIHLFFVCLFVCST